MKKNSPIMTFIAFAILGINHTSFCATHTVINTNDMGAGSLRQAILDSNADGTTPRLINFNIPGAAPHTITLANASGPFAFITQTVTIDGTTQPGWSANPAPFGTPAIIIDGSLLTHGTGVAGFYIQDTSNCVIKGFNIQSFTGNDVTNAGVFIGTAGSVANNNQVSNCYMGTDITGKIAVPCRSGIAIRGVHDPMSCNGNIITNNLLSGNSNRHGIEIFQSVNTTVIQGNFIGTDLTGTVALPNAQAGFLSFGTLSDVTNQSNNGTIIGGSLPGQGNLISGNVDDGIVLETNTNTSVVQGNLIGTDITGTKAIPNGLGITIFGAFAGTVNESCTGNIIGGSSTGQGNVIAANTAQGIFIQANVFDTVIQGNFIGTNSTNTTGLGNGSSGIFIDGNGQTYPSSNNLIGGTSAGQGNVIVNNGALDPVDHYGVDINSAVATPDILNPILGNSIFNNIGSGIILQNGGNDNQAAPSITNIKVVGSNTITITAVAPATPAASNFRLEFFINSANRNPITEGQRFIGAITSVPSGSSVMQTFVIPAPMIAPISWASATATNLNNTGGTPGDTSPFTNNFTIITLLSPISLAILDKYCTPDTQIPPLTNFAATAPIHAQEQL